MLGATYDEEGRADHAASATIPYDTLVIAIGSLTNDFGTPGVARARDRRWTRPSRPRASTAAWSTPASAPTPQAEPVRPGQLHVAIIGAGATGTELAAELHRTTRAVVAYGLDRIDPEQGHQHHPDRGRAPHPAGAAGAASREATTRAAAQARRRGPHRRAGHRGAGRRRAARRRRAHPVRARGLGGRASRRPDVLARPRRAGGQPPQPARGARRRCRPRATPTSSRSATAPPARAPGHDRPVPPRAQAAHQQASHMLGQIRAPAARASRCSPSSTATSARWSRSASTAPSAT